MSSPEFYFIFFDVNYFINWLKKFCFGNGLKTYVCTYVSYVCMYVCIYIYIYISKYRVQGLDTSFWPRCRKRSCAGNSVSPSFCSTGNDVSSLSTDTSHILMLSSLFRVWDLGSRLLLNWQRRLFPLERHVPYTYPRPWIYIHIYKDSEKGRRVMPMPQKKTNTA